MSAAAVVQDPLKETAQYVKGVGPSRFELLRKLGLETVGDILFYFPRAFEDLSDFRPIADLTEGTLQTVGGEVVEMEGKEISKGRTLTSIVISDGSDCLEGAWFNQPFIAQKFRYGQKVTFSGKPQRRFGHWVMNNPRVQYLDESLLGRLAESAGSSSGVINAVLPVYSLTEGLFADQLRRITKHVSEKYAPAVSEVLPSQLLARRRLPGIVQALRDIHVPATIEAATRARRRFVYEEFLLLQLGLALRRRGLRDRERASPLPITPKIDEHIRRLYPFSLTRDQDKAIKEICKDMASTRPMQRLLQADVGAGKTAVAVYALLLTVAHKHQAALMAPTEVLARQHWRTLNQYLARSRVRRTLLTGGLTAKERRLALAEIRMGQVDLVVGTQALIQKDVEFAKLGLVVIDEQHKFGVEQRLQFRQLGVDPHYLVLTATPIPRTIALTVFGDMDTSIIHEQPPGREPVVTKLLTESQRERLEGDLRKQLLKGRQLYVVCPLVEGSEDSDLKAAESEFTRLKDGPFAQFQVGLLHGRMDDKDKDQVMQEFRAGKVQVLVSTLVIEVGVDVPNATLMVIEHGDRFGMSQLHQLRGRVSRGPVAGECFVFAEPESDESKRRLRMFVKTADGFALADEDLKIRGMGEFFGTRQHGVGELRIGDLIADSDILKMAREDAIAMVAEDAALSQPAHAALRNVVLARYGQTLDLVRIG